MLIYFLVLFVVTLTTYVANKPHSSVATSRLFLFFSFISMVLVAGLRDKSVGTDSWSYVRYFDWIQTLQDVAKYGGDTGEYGYWYLNWLIHFVSDQYMVLFLAIAVIVVGCYQYAIVKYSSNSTISFFVFMTMGFYTFFFNGARQGIACAIMTLAIGPLLKRNLKQYLACVLIAFFFHKTALIAVPVYFLFNKGNNLKSNFLYGLLGFVGAFAFPKFIELGGKLDDRYYVYGTSGTGGGFFIVGFTSLLTLFFLVFKKSVHINRDRYCHFLNMLILGAMISVVSVVFQINPSGVLRLSLYFTISVVFLWPIVFENISKLSSKIFFTSILTMGYLAFFTLTTERFSRLVPYAFNETLHFF